MARASLFRELPDYCVVSEKHGVGDHPRAIMFALSGKIRYIDRFMSVYRNNSTPTAWTTRIRENAFLVDRLTGAVEMYTAALGHVEGEDKKLLEQTLHRYEWELFAGQGRIRRNAPEALPHDNENSAASFRRSGSTSSSIARNCTAFI